MKDPGVVGVLIGVMWVLLLVGLFVDWPDSWWQALGLYIMVALLAVGASRLRRKRKPSE